MNKKKWGRIGGLLLIVLSLILAGCWDNVPLESRNLVDAMGFYPGPKPGWMTVYFEFPTPMGMAANTTSSSGGGSGPDFTYLTGIGRSLGEAFSAAQAKSSRDLYLGHVELFVFSTHLPAPQFRTIVSSLARIGTLDKTPFVAVTGAPYAEVLGKVSPQARFPSLYFERLFSCPTCQQLGLGVRFWQLEERLATPGVDAVLPYINPVAEGQAVNRVALYRGPQYVTTLSVPETTAYALIAGHSYKTSLYLTHAYDANLIAVTGPSRLSVGMVGHHVHATVNLALTATLESLDTNTETAKQLSQISQQASTVVAHTVAHFLEHTQKLDTDVLGVGRLLSWTAPRQFARVGSWAKRYPQVRFTVHCRVTINKMGDIK